jgi:pSer/pThr/pTyr-binding forkhead associated (FHA) protein
MNCAVCRQRSIEVGLLCEDCREELQSPLRLAPEQVVSRSVGGPGVRAALIDSWGRAHAVEARTLIGRQFDGSGLSVLEASISRHHAHIQFEPTSRTWTLRDLGSANGTTVNDQSLTEAVTLQNGDRVSVGQVGFYFIADAQGLPSIPVDPMLAATIKPDFAGSGVPVVPLDDAEATGAITNDDDSEDNEFERIENTNVGIPTLSISLVEPTGGGGGLVTVIGKQVQLTTTQFELVALLVKRMSSEGHQSPLVRGFVRSSELIADLSWDTKDPGDNHVKQLVRRVRRALIKAEIGDLIESRHRFGYRLRAIPKE